MHAPGPHIRLMAYDSNSALPAGPISWGFYSGGRDRRTFRNIHQEDTRWMCSCERVTENASNLWASSKHPRHPFLDWFGINRHMLLDEEIFCTLLTVTLQCPSHSFHFLDTILDIIPVVHVVFFVGVVPWPPPPFHSRYQSSLTVLRYLRSIVHQLRLGAWIHTPSPPLNLHNDRTLPSL